MTDSVSSDIRHFYEDIARESLASILHRAFGIYCREPENGFRRVFNKRDTPENLWWNNKSDDRQVEIDFLAHVAPLSTLSDVDAAKVSENPNVQVFKSTTQTTTETSVGVAHQFQQTKSVSPEKAAPLGDDYDHFQYVIAEITCGGQKAVLAKLQQLEKDCYFLCSRASPSLTDVNDFKVLETVAFVAVVAPSLDEREIQKRIFSVSEPLPLLKELYNRGKFVRVEHKATITVIVKEISSKLDSVVESVSEQSEALEAKLSEQTEATQALEAKLSEQTEATQTIRIQLALMTEQLSALQQFLAERLPR